MEITYSDLDLANRLKLAFQSNSDEEEYIRDSEITHIYDKKQKKFLDFYYKKNQANLHALFQTEKPENLDKDGYYPLTLDEQLRLKITHENLDKITFENLIGVDRINVYDYFTYYATQLSYLAIDKLREFFFTAQSSGHHVGITETTKIFQNTDIGFCGLDFYLEVITTTITITIYALGESGNYMEIYTEDFSTVDNFKRRIIFPSNNQIKFGVSGSVSGSEVGYVITGLHIPVETSITS